MCNLSEGIEKGRAEGRKQGQEDEKLASARRMIVKGKFSSEDISKILRFAIAAGRRTNAGTACLITIISKR